MGRQEQIEERQVLDSIYPEEITGISEKEFHIAITLDTPDAEAEADDAYAGADGDADTDASEGDTQQPVVILSVRYSDDYPDTPPHLDILAPDDADARRHAYFNVAEDKHALLSAMEAIVAVQLGEPMVFSLVMAVKEAAEKLVAERKAVADTVVRKREEMELRKEEEMAMAAEREENKKFHGTRVTAETFMQWREKMRREEEEARLREEEALAADVKKGRIREAPKMTGRQLWERGLVGAGRDEGDEEEEEEDDDDDDDDGDHLAGATSTLKVNG